MLPDGLEYSFSHGMKLVNLSQEVKFLHLNFLFNTFLNFFKRFHSQRSQVAVRVAFGNAICFIQVFVCGV
jgi:hypothetical protein